MSASSPGSCLELLHAMVAIPSIVPYHSGKDDSERALGEYLASVAQAWGLAVDSLPVGGHAPNLLIRHVHDAAFPWLLFDSHLDTVGVDGMTIDPFAAEVRGGRIWGRGTCDTKGSGAAMLWALKEYAASGRNGCNVALALTVAEEHVQNGAKAMAGSQLAAANIRPAGVVVGEPTALDIVAASGGFLRWFITTTGRAYHSTRPDLGHNAVSDMARLVVAIETHYVGQISGQHPLVGRGAAAVTTCRGGTAMNIIPAECTATLDRRLVPGEDADADRLLLQHVVEDAAADIGADVTISEPEFAPPLAPTDDLQFARQCQSVLSDSGGKPNIAGALYTSNANHYAAAGWPTVVLGPGQIAQAHQPDEWLEVDQLERAVQTYRSLMDQSPPPGQ